MQLFNTIIFIGALPACYLGYCLSRLVPVRKNINLICLLSFILFFLAISGIYILVGYYFMTTFDPNPALDHNQTGHFRGLNAGLDRLSWIAEGLVFGLLAGCTAMISIKKRGS